MNRPLQRAYRIKLFDILNKRFDKEGLRTLCFELNVDYEDLSSGRRETLARELIENLERRDRIPELLTAIKQQRPDISLADVRIPGVWNPPPAIPQFYEETLAPYYRPLYGRRRLLDNVKRALNREGSMGVWIRGSNGSGRTPLAVNLAKQCVLDTGQFEDCIYYSVPSPSSSPAEDRTFRRYSEFLLNKLYVAGRVLLVIDDFDFFVHSERSEVIKFLACPALRNCKTIIVSLMVSGEREWRPITMLDKLDPDETREFVLDYAEDQPEAKEVLQSVGQDRWLTTLHDATQGQTSALVAVLERISWGTEGVESDLNWQEKRFYDALRLLETKDPVAEGTKQALKNLDRYHLHILSGLSLVATLTGLKMLEYVLGRPSDKLMPWLNDLTQRSLVETITSRDGTQRYQLVTGKRQLIREQCGQAEDLFPRFIHWWLDYAEKNGGTQYENYPNLNIEDENLTAVLEQLWDRANVPVREEYKPDIDNSKPLSLHAFGTFSSLEEEQAAEQYIWMRNHLRDYWRYEGRWSDYGRTAKRAYAAACALERWGWAAWQAFEVAWAHAQEGRCTRTDLEIAESWVAKMEEANQRRDLLGEWPALPLRMRGVIEMRRHNYRKSLCYLQRALKCFQKLHRESEYIVDILVLLAKLAMRYDPHADDDNRYETSLNYLKDALISAEKIGNTENYVVSQTRKAELMVWWGKWNDANQLLQDIEPLAEELSRKDLWAKVLYLQALVEQQHSASENQSDKKEAHLQTAIESADRSKATLRDDARTPDLCLDLCTIYSVLAALYSARRELIGDVNDETKIKACLDKVSTMLERRRFSTADVASERCEHDPDVSYEAACLQAISGDLEQAHQSLLDAIKIQPGLGVRAENDFRLDPLTKGERQIEWKQLRERAMKARSET